MKEKLILKQVNDIFKRVLDDTDIVITPQTTSADIEAWDSLNHIQLIVAIEKHFNVKFTTREIFTWKDVGEMCKTIAEKCPELCS